MAGKITIDIERCKGCELCVITCPHSCIDISHVSNKGGYFPAVPNENKCTGCAMCAIICPEAAIMVEADSNIIEIKSKDSKVGKKENAAG